MAKPKILVYDVETSPYVTEIFQLRDIRVRPEQILTESEILCFAAKWYGVKGVIYRSVYHHGKDKMVLDAWNLLDEADVIVDYYGRGLDIPRMKQEFLLAGLGPPSPSVEVDIYKTIRQFGFPSNSLDYALKRLGLEGKIKHEGQGLWHACLNGDPKAWARMKRYNIRDVTGLEELTDRLGSWVVGWPNMAAYAERQACTRCGGEHVEKRGTTVKRTGVYQRWHCLDCGKWMTGVTRLSSAKLVGEG